MLGPGAKAGLGLLLIDDDDASKQFFLPTSLTPHPTPYPYSYTHTYTGNVLIYRSSSTSLLHRPSEATARVRERRGEGRERKAYHSA